MAVLPVSLKDGKESCIIYVLILIMKALRKVWDKKVWIFLEQNEGNRAAPFADGMLILNN